MKIILLSGGSGKRLWPLSNDTRSKQFLRLLESPNGDKESMIQRMIRQIQASNLTTDIIVACGKSQKDIVEKQIGDSVGLICEPCRRDTFPAIILASAYLKDKGVDDNEPIIVIPCDTYTDPSYFNVIKKMAEILNSGNVDISLMGIIPTYPSEKYGYILPLDNNTQSDVHRVDRFIEKPDTLTAKDLISHGALWNGGVFGFKLGYLISKMNQQIGNSDFKKLLADYSNLPKISFDYAIVEKASNLCAVPYSGKWKDLGTWNTLTEELAHTTIGNIIKKDSENTHVINELNLPIVCNEANNLIIAASPDGILVSDINSSEKLKDIVNTLANRPMYEERRWGEYKVIDSIEFDDGHCALTKQLTLLPGKSISYQKHQYRDELWTIIDGEGEIVLDGLKKSIKRGDVINIPKGQLHALKALTRLCFIEVQQGENLVEEDIERFDYEW